MELHLNKKVVVITGGGSGIGRAAAKAFAQEGCYVAICGRREEKLTQVKNELALLGYEIMTASADVTDYSAMCEFADAVEKKYGGIDIWVNNAASNQMKSLMDYSVAEFKSMVDTVLVSVFSGCQIAAQHMKNGGVILNASSFSAVIPNAGRAPYSACKAAILSLTRTFAAELAKREIRVVAYVPGTFETEITRKNIEKNRAKKLAQTPLRRFGQPEECAGLLTFLASDCAGYINGTAVEITGGKFCVQNPQYAYEENGRQ